MIDDKKVFVEVERVSEGPPSDDLWSVDGRAWIEEDGEKKFERELKVNVLKDDGYFEGEPPQIVERLKDCYRRHLKEDPEYSRFSETLVEEKKKAEDLEGSVFEP